MEMILPISSSIKAMMKIKEPVTKLRKLTVRYHSIRLFIKIGSKW